MQIDRSPALNKAVSFIKELLSGPERKQLPSVRNLAVMIRVSEVTVVRAIAVLRSEGLITTIWGRGNYLKGHTPQPEPDSSVKTERIPKFMKVLNKFKQDLLDGRFPPNRAMPAINELSAMYNVSYSTIRPALATMVKERILKRNGSRYYLYIPNAVCRRRVAVIALGFEPNAVKIASERERNFFRQLSIAAAQKAVDLDIICYNDYLDTPRFFVPDYETLQSYFRKNDICGVILSSYHMKNSAECLSSIVCTGVPISIWIEDKKVLQSIERHQNHYRGITCFDTSYSTLPGMDVGRYLFDKGHRKVAYISPFHGGAWSRMRLDGLREVFSTEKSPGVYEFVLNEFSSDYSFMESVSTDSGFDKCIPVEQIAGKLEPCMRKRVSAIGFEYHKLLRDNLIFSRCVQLVKGAEAMSEISAWVCANDLIACMIMDYWNHIKLPYHKRPGLIGFDNSFKSLEMGISSYDFNTNGEVNDMITHILYPGSSLFCGKNRIIRLNGSVIERASTKR